MEQKLDPAASLIQRLGGPSAVREATGAALPTVHRWTYPKEKGGTGGFIPRRHIPALTEFARERGIEIEAEDFVVMRP